MHSTVLTRCQSSITGAWGSAAAHVMAARAQAAEPAFSDDEFEGIDMDGIDSRSRPPSPADVSPHEDDIFEVSAFDLFL